MLNLRISNVFRIGACLVLLFGLMPLVLMSEIEAQVIQMQAQQGNVVIQKNQVVRTPGGSAKTFISTIAATGELKRTLAQTEQLIEQKQYPQARRAIQNMLDEPLEYRYEKESTKMPIPGISLREYIHELLKKDPENLLIPYQQEFNPLAEVILENYKVTRDAKYLVEIVKKHYLTLTGYKAVQLLVNWHMDRAEYSAARMHLEKMLQHVAISQSDRPNIYLLLLKCSRESGAQPTESSIINKLAADYADANIVWQGKSIPLWINSKSGELTPVIRQWLQANPSTVTARPIVNWITPRGDLSGNGILTKTIPALEFRKTLPLISLNECEQQHKMNRVMEIIQANHLRNLQNDNQFIAWQPLFVGDTFLVKGVGTLKAFNVKTGELLWESVNCENAFRFLMEAFSLNSPTTSSSINPATQINDNINNQDEYGSTPDRLSIYLNDRMYNDRLAAQISSDGERVYTINDLGTLLITSSDQGTTQMPSTPGLVSSHPLVSTEFNSLQAYDLKTGKLLWKAGSADYIENANFNGFFLGVPILYNGLLYALTEQYLETHLTTFNPLTGEKIQSQPLCSSPFPINTYYPNNKIRRELGIRPVLANGLLVCPTGYNVVYGIEPLTMQVVWKTELKGNQPDSTNKKIAQQNQQQKMLFQQGAKANLPQIQFSKWQFNETLTTNNLAILPDDHGKLLAVNVDTGKLRFELDHSRAHYPVGFFRDKLITITDYSIDAWSLLDGTSVWKEPVIIDTPVGTPVISGDQIYVVTNKNQLVSYNLNNQQLTFIHQLEHPLAAGNLLGNNQHLAMVGRDRATIFLSEPQTAQYITQKLASPDLNTKFLAMLRDQQVRYFNKEISNEQFLNQLLTLFQTLSGNSNSVKDQLADIITIHMLDGLKTDFLAYQPYTKQIRPILKSPELMFRLTERLYHGNLQELNVVASYSSLIEALNAPLIFQASTYQFGAAQNPHQLQMPVVDTALYRTKELTQVTMARWINGRFQDLKQKYSDIVDNPQQSQLWQELVAEKISAFNRQEVSKENLYLTWAALAPVISRSSEEFSLLTTFIKHGQPQSLLEERLLGILTHNKIPEHAAWSLIELISIKSKQKQIAQAQPLIIKLQQDYADVVAHEHGKVSEWLDNHPEFNVNSESSSEDKGQTKFTAIVDLTSANKSKPYLKSMIAYNYNRPNVRHEFAFYNTYYNTSEDRLFSLRDDNNRKLFEVQLPEDFSAAGLNRSVVTIDGNLLIFSNSIDLSAYDLSNYSADNQPKLLWKMPIIKVGQQSAYHFINRVILNRSVVEIEGNEAFNFRSMIGNKLCYSHDQLISIIGRNLTAIDPLTAEIFWTQEDFPAKSTLHPGQQNVGLWDKSKNKLHRYHNSDGAKIDEVTFPLPGWTVIDWFDHICIQNQEAENLKWMAGFNIDHTVDKPEWKRSFVKESMFFVDNSQRTPQILVYNGKDEIIQIDPLNGQTINKFEFIYDRETWGNLKKLYLLEDKNQQYIITHFLFDVLPLDPLAFVGVKQRDAHGPVLCFSKGNSKPLWTTYVKKQFLFEETPLDYPVLCFGAINGNMTTKAMNGPYPRETEVVILDKKTGINLVSDNLKLSCAYVGVQEFKLDHKLQEYKIQTSDFNIIIKTAGNNAEPPDDKSTTNNPEKPAETVNVTPAQ